MITKWSGGSLKRIGLRVLILTGCWGWLGSMSAAETAIVFGPPVEVATGTTSDRALAADLDGDGLRDLVLLPQVVILRNAGAGAPPGIFRFEAPIQFGVFAYNARLADLNGDGRPDLVLGASNAVVVVENLATSGALAPNSFGPPLYLTINSNASPTTIYRTDL